MARNTITIAAPPERVFDLLLDPRHCAYWVVGTKEIASVDDGWPLQGTGFDARVGVGPLRLPARTTLLGAQRPRALSLATTVGPVPATIELTITDSDGACTVTMHEHVDDPLWRLLIGPGADIGLRLRNLESLHRLKALAERQGGADGSWLRSALSGIDIFGESAVQDVVAAATHAYVTVDARSGPHVTPELFAVHAGRLWAVTAAATVKARTIERRPPVGVLLTAGARAIVVRGEAVVLDPLVPRGWTSAVQESAQVAGALLHYAGRNAWTLLPLARNLLSSIPRQGLGSRRVLVAVRPESAVVLRGDRVVERFGSWPDARTGTPTGARSGAADVSALPAEFQDVVEDRVRAVLAWETPSGPVPLPAYWDADRSEARVSSAIAATLPPRSRVGLMLVADERIADQAGVLLRGTGSMDTDGTASVEFERAAYWSDSIANGTEL